MPPAKKKTGEDAAALEEKAAADLAEREAALEQREAELARKEELQAKEFEQQEAERKRLAELEAAAEAAQKSATEQSNAAAKAQRQAEAALEGQRQELARQGKLQEQGRYVPKPTGTSVGVKVGDLIAYHATKGGTEVQVGGWFKCSMEDSCTPDVPIISQSRESFSYDTGIGRPYHSVKHKTIKRYLKREAASVQVAIPDTSPTEKIHT